MHVLAGFYIIINIKLVDEREGEKSKNQLVHVRIQKPNLNVLFTRLLGYCKYHLLLIHFIGRYQSQLIPTNL